MSAPTDTRRPIGTAARTKSSADPRRRRLVSNGPRGGVRNSRSGNNAAVSFDNNASRYETPEAASQGNPPCPSHSTHEMSAANEKKLMSSSGRAETHKIAIG